jgi:hypothetical protein
MLHFDWKAYIKCKYVHFVQQPWSSQAQTPCTPKGWLRRTLLYCRSHWESLYEYKQTSNTVQLHLLLLYLVKWKNQESEDVNAVTSHFLKLFWLKIFSISLSCEYLCEFSKKFETALMGCPGAWGSEKKCWGTVPLYNCAEMFWILSLCYVLYLFFLLLLICLRRLSFYDPCVVMSAALCLQ